MLLGGIPLVLGGAGLVLNQLVNPHTSLHYAFPPDAGPIRPPTPPCGDEQHATESVTEGPFYKPDTPERRLVRTGATSGSPLTFSGRVLTPDCRPIAGAVVDLWSSDGNGIYDNDGFALRGHQFTDRNGRFTFETVHPKGYANFGVHRTAHLHVKVQAPGTQLLTTQLYFPNDPANDHDFFFDQRLLLHIDRESAFFDFVIA
jgi:protocatechuate 3,4-dioxygenase beta subunit